MSGMRRTLLAWCILGLPAQVLAGSGADLAAEAVKEKLRKLISEEDCQKPLSDSALVKLLGQEGICIARRTVAKYREALGILSSTQRKQMF